MNDYTYARAGICRLGISIMRVMAPMGALWMLACGNSPSSSPEDAQPAPTLDTFLPAVPAPTGETQAAWAGEITPERESELIPGPASSGMVGDYFLRNQYGRYVIQAPTRVIGVIPQGGNLVDAVSRRPDGTDASGDQCGELSLIYVLGRTCEHETIEVVRDGSGGGAAVLRARGRAAANDYLNLRGIGLFSVSPRLNPDFNDRVECATTYTLHPDADHLQVQWTLFNPGDSAVRGPVATLSDTGGETYTWSALRGFVQLGISSLNTLSTPAPTPYVVYQGPEIAYGILPRHERADTPNVSFVVVGVSALLLGTDKLTDLLDPEGFVLDLAPLAGATLTVDFALGRDAADIEKKYREGRNEPTFALTGTARWQSGSAVQGARIGAYRDSDGDGAIGDADPIATYMIPAEDGSFAADLPRGTYLLRAEVYETARSETIQVELVAAASGIELVLPDPVDVDFVITDSLGTPIPARLFALGRHPVSPDERLFDTDNRRFGVVAERYAVRGTTVDLGDGADEPLRLPAGGTYRLLATRGTEWSAAEQLLDLTAGTPQTIELTLHQVAPADGYIASEYHVHQIGSPDSPITYEHRVASAVAEGIELFAATDHDYVSDIQPTVETLGLGDYIRIIAGIEVTPFAYGHFNAWPMVPDMQSPSRGAIDWARGTAGYAMIPAEIFSAMRSGGAELIQINHPRSASGSSASFNQFFDRAGIRFDYERHQIVSDLALQPVPNAWLRLPETSLWDDSFNALEVWNRLDLEDTNGDGVREMVALDVVMRDWFNFLCFGLGIAPLANSDTHSSFKDGVGMPRTYVRVGDDSARALASGDVVPDLLATLTGAAPRDIVLTNGPHIAVSPVNEPSVSLIGAVMDGQSGQVTLDVRVVAPDWAVFDTIEVFVNAAPDVSPEDGVTVLTPLYCYTSRDPKTMMANDVCALASGGARPVEVTVEEVAPGITRHVAVAQVTIAASEIVNRTGATGQDAWVVIRARGNRAIFPLWLANGTVTDQNLDLLVTGTKAERDAALVGVGVPATAFTAPIFVDFDGGGYTAVFSPQ